MNLRLTPGAEFDIDDALAWYRERGHGIADQFLQALDECLESVQSNPLACLHGHRDPKVWQGRLDQ